MFAVALAVAAIPEALRLDRDNCAGDGNPENGQGACDYQRSEGGGEPGLCVGDLFG